MVDRSTNGLCCPRLGDRPGACFEGHCLPAGACERRACTGGTCGNHPTCIGNADCGCASTAAGGTFCARDGACLDLASCPNGQADCPADTICVVNTCCAGGAVCVPRSAACPAGGGPVAGARARRGPTLASR